MTCSKAELGNKPRLLLVETHRLASYLVFEAAVSLMGVLAFTGVLNAGTERLQDDMNPFGPCRMTRTNRIMASERKTWLSNWITTARASLPRR